MDISSTMLASLLTVVLVLMVALLFSIRPRIRSGAHRREARPTSPGGVGEPQPGRQKREHVEVSPSRIWAVTTARVGKRSRVAGVGFVALTVVLLLLSYWTKAVVFEIDSVVSFLMVLVLFFSEPRRKVQPRLLDAVLSSTERSIAELANAQYPGFNYVPGARGYSGVVMVPIADGKASSGTKVAVTPPGRAMAELFARETGILNPTMESLDASLPGVVTETFGLAGRAELEQKGDSVRVMLGAPSFECSCVDGVQTPHPGVPGCTVASFFAVLVCASAQRRISLMECKRDRDADTWEVSMQLEQREGPS